MKKGLKVMAATTAAAMMLSMSMSAMAAEYFTTTEYAIEGEKEVVNVSTTVYSLNGTEEVTYLVHAGEVKDDNIVYIDQANAAEATDGNLVFDFKADYDKLVDNSAEVLLASDAQDETFTVADGEEGNVVVGENTVTFSAVGGTVYVDAADLEAASAATKLDEITFYLIPAPGYTVDGATVAKNGGDAAEVISEVYVAEGIADGDSFVFTFAEIAEDAVPEASTVESNASKDGYTANKFEATTESRRQFTLFGSALGAKEFGILVAAVEFEKPETVEEFNTLISRGKAVKLAAAGASTAGKFAISIYEEKEGENFVTSLRNDNIYACVYAINGDNLAISDVAGYGLN